MASSWKRTISIVTAVCVSLVALHSLYSSPYVYYQASSLDYDPVLLNDADYCSYRNMGPVFDRPGSQAFIVTSLKHENTSWLDQFSPDYESHTYVVDDSTADLTVPLNKGREAMAYLTYIIDHYHRLPEVMVFLHASQYQWHNEDPFYDGVPMLQRLRLDHVRSKGYSNLRCTWELGCPADVRPSKLLTKMEAAFEPHNQRANTDALFEQAFGELYPEEAADSNGALMDIAAPCCAQFAVTATQVRQRPLCDYERYRDWIMATPLPDSISGRIFELTWHIMFGMPAVTCPSAESCFCQQYGLCDLECTDGACKGRYWVPPKYMIPAQWPIEGPGTNGLPTEGWWEK